MVIRGGDFTFSVNGQAVGDVTDLTFNLGELPDKKSEGKSYSRAVNLELVSRRFHKKKRFRKKFLKKEMAILFTRLALYANETGET